MYAVPGTPSEAVHYLAAVELHAAPVLLYHPNRVDLDFFIRREAPPSGQTLPAPENHSRIPGRSRVHDLIAVLTAASTARSINRLIPPISLPLCPV